MNLAEQLDQLKARGFDLDRAQIIVLIREAAVLLFAAFPDSFVLYGGANLILFHESMRTSRDLDLLTHGAALPNAGDISKVLSEGLQELGKLLGFAPLKVDVNIAKPVFLKLQIVGSDGRSLFTVDLGGLGTVLKSGIEEHHMEALALDARATVKSVSRDHLLLQKAEAFVFRSAVKARDAYDIRLLLDAGARLSGTLEAHLADALAMREVGPEQLAFRFAQLTPSFFRAQLADVLPAAEYKSLEHAGFEPLKTALEKLFQKWL
jgi:hypothetical protein